MNERLMTGTVRARQGDKHLVVLPDGTRRVLVLEGNEIPRIGGDVIGLVDWSRDEPRLRLVKDVTRLILQGRVLISMSGRPDVTARMLARMLQGAPPAIVKPGVGGIIERTPDIQDPDLAWVLGVVDPAARRLGIALNIVDPLALANAAWTRSSLTEDILPADASGEAGGLKDLRRVMRAGFTPICRRTMEKFGRSAAVSSVDFIMPYSPFATGFSYSADIGAAFRDEVPTWPIPPSDARRLSAFREVSLAFAQRYIGRVGGDVGMARHMEDAFADAASAIAFIKSGGEAKSVQKWAKLRGAALARWDGEGEAPPATGATLEAVVRPAKVLDVDDVEGVFQLAASAARANAPTSASELSAMKARASDRGVFINLETTTPGTLRIIRRAYERDLDDALARISGAPTAVERFCHFGLSTTPSGLEDVFDESARRAGASPDFGREIAMEDAANIGDGDEFFGAPEFSP